MKLIRMFFLFAICFMAYGFSCEDECACEKVYVQPEQVNIETNGIFVRLFDNWVMIDALHADANGLYFSKAMYDGFLGPIPAPAPAASCPLCHQPLAYPFGCLNPDCISNKGNDKDKDKDKDKK